MSMTQKDLLQAEDAIVEVTYSDGSVERFSVSEGFFPTKITVTRTITYEPR